jgi:two-component system KDP operon response regulator KdpE
MAETARVYVAALRKKLGDHASSPRLILTEPGIGFRWLAEEDSDAAGGHG